MQNAVEMVKKVSKLCGCEAAGKARLHGLTLTQVMVLSAVRKGTGTAAEIALKLGADKPTISGVIKRLIKKGFLTAEPDKEDKRYKVLRLTTAAGKVLDRAGKCPQNAETAMFAGFTGKEKMQFIKYLERISGNIERNR